MTFTLKDDACRWCWGGVGWGGGGGGVIEGSEEGINLSLRLTSESKTFATPEFKLCTKVIHFPTV